jgi:HlyD family secretion protein
MSVVKSKKNNRKILYILVGIAALAIVAAVLNARKKPKGTEVSVAEVETRNIKETVSASGKIYPEKEVKISSDVSGEIVELYVKEGDSVVAGQILAKIDPEAYVSAVDRGEAGLQNAKSMMSVSKTQIQSNIAQKEQIEAQLDNARTIHKRNEQLKKDGVISQADLDQSLATLKQLEANLRSAEAGIISAKKNVEAAEYSIKGSSASLKELRTSLNRTIIKSPTNGIVSKLDVEKGERVVGTVQMAGTEMMRISNLNAMEVQVDVSENDILKVSKGDEVDVEVDAYVGRKFKGVVTEIANSAKNLAAVQATNSDQVTNFVVKVSILESSYKDIGTKNPLRPGMSASVEIFTDEQVNVTAVPIQCVAVREKSNGKKVSDDDKKPKEDKDITVEFDEVIFVIKNDTVEVIKVVTGIQDDEYIMIQSGLKANDKVISGPYTEVSKNLKSGDKVRIKEEKDDKKDKK